MSEQTEQIDQWAVPQDVDGITIAFPANVCGTLLPPRDILPDEFRTGWHRDSNQWCKLAETWFFSGLHGKFVTKNGIDETKAIRHLSACMGSFEPKHEHKIGGVGWLMSRWFVKFVPSPKATRKPEPQP